MTRDDKRRRQVGLVAIREATAILAVVRSLVGDSIKGKTVVWVDDHPENNMALCAAFEEIGARVCLARSTTEGMDLLQGPHGTIDLVISDMGRGDDHLAGLSLLDAMEVSGMTIPCIIYSDSPFATEQSRQILEKGGIGPVLGPERLARAVSRALEGSGSPTNECA